MTRPWGKQMPVSTCNSQVCKQIHWIGTSSSSSFWNCIDPSTKRLRRFCYTKFLVERAAEIKRRGNRARGKEAKRWPHRECSWDGTVLVVDDGTWENKYQLAPKVSTIVECLLLTRHCGQGRRRIDPGLWAIQVNDTPISDEEERWYYGRLE